MRSTECSLVKPTAVGHQKFRDLAPRPLTKHHSIFLKSITTCIVLPDVTWWRWSRAAGWRTLHTGTRRRHCRHWIALTLTLYTGQGQGQDIKWHSCCHRTEVEISYRRRGLTLTPWENVLEVKVKTISDLHHRDLDQNSEWLRPRWTRQSGYWIVLTWTRTSQLKKTYWRSSTWSTTTWCYWTKPPVGRDLSRRSGLCSMSRARQKLPRYTALAVSPNFTIGSVFSGYGDRMCYVIC